ncbi:uncharacterized protein LOC119358129 [Triticum dicoccoides]|uniref:uncharacterized protein LOC119358129 n=1 Tax=Triticum dicoccoides TaxID=85692 RepID=UPI001890AE9D|nr:uncharacterized protein LOC119358129 [Triticum dicoccoides]
MATEEEPTVDVKLFVDKEKNKVLFAESGKEFVDVLFGFLTLPLGTVVRLLGKQSQVGCLDEIYKSVEELSNDFFRTEACKAMLLRPISAAAKQCCDLKVRVEDTKHREVYVCGDTSCCAKADGSFSSVPGAACKCGCLKFIVTDDLQVAPASTSLMLSLLKKFGVEDPSRLEQRMIQLSSVEMTNLLKRSLTSKQPLTGHCFDVAISIDVSALEMLLESLHPKQGNDAEHELDNVRIRVLRTNSSSLLYAEVNDDFVELLFGFLTVPLGSIIKTYGSWPSIGCIANLYSRIDGSAKGCIREPCQCLLLSPKLAPFFTSEATKIVQAEESAQRKQQIKACFKCIKTLGFPKHVNCHAKDRHGNYVNCRDTVKTTNLCECDPKSPKGGSDKGKGYVKQGPQNFMVTDNLHVLPLSLENTIQVVCEAKIQSNDLAEKEFSLAKSQLTELLKAA